MTRTTPDDRPTHRMSGTWLGRYRPSLRRRSHHRSSRNRLLAPLALLLAVASLTPLGTVGAAVTDRSTIAGNRFGTDPSRVDPYGLRNPSVSPQLGRVFVDDAQGSLSFDIHNGMYAPEPFPAVRSGEVIEVVAELPASLRATTAYGWCNSTDNSELRKFSTIVCTTNVHPSGASTVKITLTAKMDLDDEYHWRLLKRPTIAVTATAGRVDAIETALVTIEMPDDDEHHRQRSADVPFTTMAGTASALSSWQPELIDASGIVGDAAFYTGDKGYVRVSTGLRKGINRGVTIKTGESFTYRSTLPSHSTGGLVYDTHPDPVRPTVNACTRQVEGYGIRCESGDGFVTLITTRTGPDVVNDYPIDRYAYIPVMSTYWHPTEPTPLETRVTVNLTADMEQLGSRPISPTSPAFRLFRNPRSGIGVHDFAVQPYVGSTFAEDGTGRITFDFFSSGPAVPAGSLIKSGDTVTATLQLGRNFNVMTDASGPQQNDRTRNWCDLTDDGWNPDLQGYLGTPDCTAAMDDDGAITITIATTALQDVPNSRLAGGFQMRMISAERLNAGLHEVSVNLSASRPGLVTHSVRRGIADVRAMTTDAAHASSLGIWRADAFTNPSTPGTPAPKEGSLTWFPDPTRADDGQWNWPLSVETGDTITYRVELPTGLAYLPTPSDGGEDVCALPDRYDGFAASCVVTGSTVDVTLTRTGAANGATFLDPALPFVLPVRNTGTGDQVAGDVVITLSTTIDQSGSDRRRAVVPVTTTTVDPYGLYNTTIAPLLGRSFVDEAKGAITFDLYEGTSAPEPYLLVKTGEQIVVTADLPSSLRLTDEYGWCDPATDQRTFVAVCETTEGADGSSVRLTLTAQTDVSGRDYWRVFKTHTIGVVTVDGQVAGTETAQVQISLPGDDDYDRQRTATPSFTTTTGLASDMLVLDPTIVNNVGGTGFATGDTGYLTLTTNLADPAVRGLTMRTGESFSFIFEFQSLIAYDPTPDPANPTANSCAQTLDGYEVTCTNENGNIQFTVTRTGPEVVDARPVITRQHIPVVSTWPHPSTGIFSPFVQTSADMEQLGARPSDPRVPSFSLYPARR